MPLSLNMLSTVGLVIHRVYIAISTILVPLYVKLLLQYYRKIDANSDTNKLELISVTLGSSKLAAEYCQWLFGSRINILNIQ